LNRGNADTFESGMWQLTEDLLLLIPQSKSNQMNGECANIYRIAFT